MADVELEIVDLATGVSLGKYPLTICTSQNFQLDIGNYRFIATYLKTQQALQADITIVEGVNTPLDFTFNPVTHILTINTTTGGITTPVPSTYIYNEGAIATVQANPAAGFYFDHWELDGVNIGSTNPIQITMDADHTLTGYFSSTPTPTFQLTISTTTGGNTSPSPGTYTYSENSIATVTAIPNAGYQLDHWQLDGFERGADENPISLVMNRDYTLTAYFTALPPPEYTLTIVTATDGTTNPAPGSNAYVEGTTVQVTAIPDTGYYFDHWELDGVNVGSTNPIGITMNTNHTLTAYFSSIPLPQYTLSVTAISGGTTNPPPGIYQYIEGTAISVQALPSSGYAFDHWVLDGYSVVDNPVLVTMDKNHSLTAYFAELPPPEFILTVAAKPGGTTDPAPGDHKYVSGTIVQVTAKPDSGYTFDHWELDGNAYTTNPISVLMDNHHSLTAYFSLVVSTYKLNISTTSGGTTDPTPGAHEYLIGVTVTITANPASGYKFDNWELDGAVRTENPINILMDKDHTLRAVFSSAPPATPFDQMWAAFEEFCKKIGAPVPPKPPAPPPLPSEYIE